jgi:hypothetical protein
LRGTGHSESGKGSDVALSHKLDESSVSKNESSSDWLDLLLCKRNG